MANERETTEADLIWNKAKQRMLIPLKFAGGALLSFCMWQFNTLASMSSDEALRLVYMPDEPEMMRWIAGWVATAFWWSMIAEICFAVLATPGAIQVLAWPEDFVRTEKAKGHANVR